MNVVWRRFSRACIMIEPGWVLRNNTSSKWQHCGALTLSCSITPSLVSYLCCLLLLEQIHFMFKLLSLRLCNGPLLFDLRTPPNIHANREGMSKSFPKCKIFHKVINSSQMVHDDPQAYSCLHTKRPSQTPLISCPMATWPDGCKNCSGRREICGTVPRSIQSLATLGS